MIKAVSMTKNVQHTSAVGIQFSAALSALGQNPAELQHALTSTENTLSQREDLIAGRTVWVGAADQTLIQDIPEVLSPIDSRNLRFALTALAKIETESGWSSKQIPRLLNTVFYCLVKEESWNFVKEFKNPIVDFKQLSFFTINRIKEVMPHLF